MKPHRFIQTRCLMLSLLLISSKPGTDAQTIDAQSRIAALEAELSLLESQIASLEDVKAIRRLQRAYGYYWDKALTSDVVNLFSDDATVEIAQMGVFVGKQRIGELYQALLGDGLSQGQLNNQMILQGVVHVDPSGMTANGRWRAIMQLGQHGELAEWAEGPYENEYTKVNGVWQISKLHWYMTVHSPYNPGWHIEHFPITGPLENLPPDRPPTKAYKTYPSAYLPAFHYSNPTTDSTPAGATQK